jgi:hypothetical protein
MSETTTETTTEPTTTEQGNPDDGEKALGDAGKQALDRMKAERTEATRKATAEKQRADALQAQLDEIAAANATDQEKAVAAARKEGETSALERVNSRLVRAEARAIAAELNFRDPADALGQIDLGEITVSNDGEVDTEAVKTALADLAERKAYLLKSKADTSASDAGIGAIGTTVTDTTPGGLIRAGLAATSKTK